MTRPTLIFIHGAWCSAYHWQRLVPYFEDLGYTCIAPDLPAHGNDPRPIRRATMGAYIKHIETVMNGVERPILIGFSMGGFIAQQVARRKKIAGLALLASVPPAGVRGITWRTIRRDFGSFLRSVFAFEISPLVATHSQRRALLYSRTAPDPEIDDQLFEIGRESFLAFADMLLRPLFQRRSGASQPTLVIGAQDDHVFNATDIYKTAQTYDVTACWIPGSHMIPTDIHWQKAAEKIQIWLETQT